MQTIQLCLANGFKEPDASIIHPAIISTEKPGLVIPQFIALRLRLDKIDERFLYGLEEERFPVAQVGPVVIKAGRHQMTCCALVWGSQVRIGTTLLTALGWDRLPDGEWVFTDKPIHIPTILPAKNDSHNA